MQLTEYVSFPKSVFPEKVTHGVLAAKHSFPQRRSFVRILWVWSYLLIH